MSGHQHVDLKPHLRRPGWEDAQPVDWSRFLKRPLFTESSLDCDVLFAEKTVLITGAGGSIGSALAERLMEGLAGTLLLLDHSQKKLDALFQKFLRRHLTVPQVKFFHVDILDQRKLREIFLEHQPQVIFHAAAMKHVAALESDPFIALETNVLGTLRLLETIQDSELEYFIHVSTDKAVNPTSVLGVTKRIAELLLLAAQWDATRRLSMRMGNVLGSSGSVVPLFLESLEHGLPLQITDPQATRYFLSLEEAAAFLMKSLEVQQGALLLPEMGRSRRIIELADFLLSEWKGGDCTGPPTVTGLRDGEKLSEHLTYDYEYLESTAVPSLYEVCGSAIFDPAGFANSLGQLLTLVVDRRGDNLIQSLLRLVPEFAPSPTLLRYVH